jgi:hypothetical protein
MLVCSRCKTGLGLFDMENKCKLNDRVQKFLDQHTTRKNPSFIIYMAGGKTRQDCVVL